MIRDFSVHCKYCQPFSEGYFCSCMDTFHKEKNKEWKVRECYYQYIYDKNWTFHPCPYFIGEIRFHEDKYGTPYKKNKYARIQVLAKDENFTAEEIIKL